MRKVLRSLLLAGMVASGTAGLVSLSPVTAQTGKTDPKTKVDPKAPEVKGSVVYRKGKDDKWRLFIQDESGKSLAQSSVGYEKQEDVIKLADTLKALLNANKPKEDK